MTDLESSSPNLTGHDRRQFEFRVFKTLQMWSDHPIITDAVCKELELYRFADNKERMSFIQSLKPFEDIKRVKETLGHLKRNGVYRNKQGMRISFEEYSESELIRVHKEMSKFVVLIIIVILLVLFIIVFITQ